LFGSLIAILAFAESAEAATYQVGPGKAFATLQQVAPKLAPGDVVEVDGGSTYPGDLTLTESGTAAAKITLVGKRSASGRRPVLSGGTNTVHIHADHYVIKGFEVTGGASRCVFHHGDDITIEDTAVHDCPNHGILGADEEAGSLSLSYVEVYACGSGDSHHPIYMATDEETHPGSVFRMEHCYVHDGNGGNNVKSRAQRNEIRYNWIEGALYHEIELIGPDGADEGLFREDSDVVGNVFRKTKTGYVARFGGDGTGETNGRYRFVGNTVILAPGSSAVFRLYDGIQSVEMHDNVFTRAGGGGVQLIRDSDASWATGSAVIAGSHNWIPAGSTDVPSAWTATLTGADPGFVNAEGLDFRPGASSPLRGQGVVDPAGPPGYPFPSPLVAAVSQPPLHAMEAFGTASPRAAVGAIDIGAFASGSIVVVPQSVTAGEAAPATPAAATPAAGRAADPLASTDVDEVDESPGCSVGAGSSAPPVGALAVALSAGLLRWARRRRTRG
jgi:hypothetical protein